MKKLKELSQKLFLGETTVNKRDLWFIGAICLLLGVVCGLKKAPWTHGVMIGSNNGNNSGNYDYGRGSEDDCCCADNCECEN